MAELELKSFAQTAPAGWRTMRIGDVLEIVSPPVRMRDTEEYRLVSVRRRYGGMFDRERLSGREIFTKDLEWVVPGAFIIAKRQIVHGACALVPEEFDGAAVASSYAQLLPREGHSIRFFNWLAQTPEMRKAFLDASQGVVLEKLMFSVDQWLDTKVHMPPLSQQERIAEILNTVDEVIRKTGQAIEKLRRMKQGLLHDLLTRGIDDNGNLRDPLHHPEQFRDTAWGRIPADWDVRPLGTLAEVSSGVTLGRQLSGTGTLELPYLRVANVQDGHIDTSDLKTIKILQSELPRFALQFGDVLMTEGGDFDKLGRGTVWDNRISPCLHQNHIFRVRTQLKLLLPWYLNILSVSCHGRRYFLHSSKQTTNLASINSTQLKAFPILLPCLAEQQAIVQIVQAHIQQLNAAETEIKKLRDLKRGLMDDLLTGRVLVSV